MDNEISLKKLQERLELYDYEEQLVLNKKITPKIVRLNRTIIPKYEYEQKTVVLLLRGLERGEGMVQKYNYSEKSFYEIKNSAISLDNDFNIKEYNKLGNKITTWNDTYGNEVMSITDIDEYRTDAEFPSNEQKKHLIEHGFTVK